MANPKQKKVQNALIQIINDLGFNAVSLWRSSLKPLSLLESIKGETPNEISSSLGNMFDDTLKLPEIKTHDVAEFVTQKEAIGGF
jgi:hypothetical protein